MPSFSIASYLSTIKKKENLILSILLYCVALIYLYQYLNIEDKYAIFSPDEVFYYIEAKAVSAHNIYQTPLSLDGNTSFIGNFGSHGISYAIKDGWLSKLFFHAQDPPIIWINLLTCIIMLAAVLLFKTFSVNIRLKIALIIATHYILFCYTLSYMQETIQFLFAVLALRTLYLLYQQPKQIDKKHLYQYLILILIAITFRYSWFIWGLGLLPLAENLKNFIKYGLVVGGLLLFALFIGRYIYAPYPYEEITAFRLIRTESLSLVESIHLVWLAFIGNLKIYLTPNVQFITVCMRYLLLTLLIINLWFSIAKRNRFTIACTLIGWTYFIACMAFYFLTWQADERILALLNPLLAFSLIGSCTTLLFYPIIIFQIYLFPEAIRLRKQNYECIVPFKEYAMVKSSRELSYSKLKYLISDNRNVVISLPIHLTWHARPNYLVDFPLVTDKGYAIHYYMYVNGNDLRKSYNPDYIITTQPVQNKSYRLIHSDQWMCLYKINN